MAQAGRPLAFSLLPPVQVGVTETIGGVVPLRPDKRGCSRLGCAPAARGPAWPTLHGARSAGAGLPLDPCDFQHHPQPKPWP